MRNTLDTKTTEQLTIALKSYNSYLCEIPVQFHVLDEYLHGLTVPVFCEAFRQLQSIITSMYEYICDMPQSVELVSMDKKSGEWKVQTSQHISCVKKMLYVLGRFSVLNAGTLIISMEELLNAYMTYYPNCSVELSDVIKEFDSDKRNKFYKAKHVDLVLTCYKAFGFQIETLNDNVNVKLIIQYPANPSVLTAIKAFAMPEICRISFGFDFTKFNYRVFSHPSNAKIPLEDLYSYSLLSAEHQNFLSKLNCAMSEMNVDYGKCESGWYNGTLPCQYIYKNKIRILQNIEYGLIPYVVMRFGKKADKMARYIESLPEAYRCRIERCKGCRKGECDHRIPVATKDEKYILCNVAWWYFPATVDAIPYITAAYKIV